MTVIILNAPAGAGKDTIADEFVKLFEFRKAAFKDKLYEIAYDLLYHYNDSITYEHFLQRCTDRYTKDSVWGLLPYRSGTNVSYTPREWLIHVSEKIVKPLYGQHYFGQYLAKNIRPREDVIVSDGGFNGEVLPVAELHGGNVVVVQFKGMGCDTFEGDSRSWITCPDVNIVKMPVDNSDKIQPWMYANMIMEEVYKNHAKL